LAAGGNGSVTLTDPGSTLTTTRSVYVGESGTGMLTVQNGGVMTSERTNAGDGIYIGYYSGSAGSVTVDGAGSQWVIPVMSIQLGIFSNGTGSLTIQNGGKVTLGSGGVSVTNPGSSLT